MNIFTQALSESKTKTTIKYYRDFETEFKKRDSMETYGIF